MRARRAIKIDAVVRLPTAAAADDDESGFAMAFLVGRGSP